MIIVQIKCGLGNQMFQYAFGKAMSAKKNTEVKYDLSWYEKTDDITEREYGLDAFKTKLAQATLKEIEKLKGKPKGKISKRVKRAYAKYIYLPKKKYLIERSSEYVNLERYTMDEAYFEGYWQSHKYFECIEETLRSELKLKEGLSPESIRIEEDIKRQQSVNIHFRRGDYIENEKVSKIHSVVDNEYYKKAINIILQRVENPVFYAFSDDPDWIQENAVFPVEINVINVNGKEKAHEDLILMSKCKHHIIANSSFSWWAAWLSKEKGKIVIAPQKWNTKRKGNSRDRYPEGWITI